MSYCLNGYRGICKNYYMTRSSKWITLLKPRLMMQVCSRKSSPGDARADVSCKLCKVRHAEIWSELRLPLFYLHETFGRATLAPDSREPISIV
jgi:hypothetical protein